MRIVLVCFVIILLVISFGLTAQYNRKAALAQGELDGERYHRMVAEESLQKANQKVNSLTSELKRAENKTESIEMALERTKAINLDLKDRLDRASKNQAVLDQRITELQQLVGPL